MSSQNLFKSGWIVLNKEDIRVIDSNQTAERKLAVVLGADSKDDGVKSYHPVSFDDGASEENGIGALFGAAPKADAANDVEAAANGDEAAGEEASEGENAEKALTSAQVEEILADARAQAEEILANARTQAEQEAQQAYEEAKSRGEQEGYQEGIQKAHDETVRLQNEYAQKERELVEQYEEKLDEMEPHLVHELSSIYEHIFAVDLSQYRSVLMHLIGNTMRSVQVSDHYLIHVSEHDFSYVSMQKAQLVEDSGAKNAQIDIVEDRTLSKNQCLVETDDGIFDCSLSVELTELKRKLQLLAYGSKKE